MHIIYITSMYAFTTFFFIFIMNLKLKIIKKFSAKIQHIFSHHHCHSFRISCENFCKSWKLASCAFHRATPPLSLPSLYSTAFFSSSHITSLLYVSMRRKAVYSLRSSFFLFLFMKRSIFLLVSHRIVT